MQALTPEQQQALAHPTIPDINYSCVLIRATDARCTWLAMTVADPVWIDGWAGDPQPIRYLA